MGCELLVVAYGNYFPDLGWGTRAPALESGVLATGQPGQYQDFIF